MKPLYYIFILISFSALAQQSIQTELIETVNFKADSLIGINNFGTTFYTLNHSLIKKEDNKTHRYSNIQLGPITAVNSFNPLKISVFYKAFNTVTILDNRLAEIYKIDFNQINPYRNISHSSTGSDNTIWIFNQNIMQLELYDYRTNTTRAKTIPIENNILDLTSNYNFCWLLTKKYIYKYNYFGSLVSKIPNTGFTKIKENNGNLVLKKENTLFYKAKDAELIVPISIKNLLINQFFVTNEIVYIYTGGLLHLYQLKLK